MKLFGRESSPDNLEDTTKKVESFIDERSSKIQEMARRLVKLEESLKRKEENRDAIIAEQIALQTHLDSIIINITTKLDDPNVVDSFANSTDLYDTKARIAQTAEKIRTYYELKNEQASLDALRTEFDSFQSGAQTEHSDLEQSLADLKSAEADIERLSKDPNGEREESHRQVDRDVERLTTVRSLQLEEEQKAENIISILQSLDEAQQSTFLSNLKPADKKLVDDFQSGVLSQKHEKALHAQAVKTDPELVEGLKKQKREMRGAQLHHEGNLHLNSLTSAEGLILPQSVGGDLYLNSLTSAEGLILPQSVGGYLNLNSLTSAEGLNLPESVSGDLYLNSLTSAEKNVLRTKYPTLSII
jgi:DNA repair exonuclease SbcCD ATPase subunit